MIGRTNVGGGAGGAGGGATLVVSSPVNVSVTVSKDDKSYTKNSGSLGSTTFKGLATGTWTVTISGNGQTATKTIEITADYAITIAFFSATINITYPANSTCVVTNSGGQTVASDTNTTSSEKTFIATVNATGTYTVTATATDGSGNTKLESVEITRDGQILSLTLSYRYLLYNSGNQFEDITGGYTKFGSTTLDQNSINFSEDLSAGAGLTSNNLIDFSGYSTLIFSGNITSQYSSYELAFGVGTQKISGGGAVESTKFAAKISPSVGETEFRLLLPNDFVGYLGVCGVGSGTITKIEVVE